MVMAIIAEDLQMKILTKENSEFQMLILDQHSEFQHFTTFCIAKRHVFEKAHFKLKNASKRSISRIAKQVLKRLSEMAEKTNSHQANI